MKKRKYLQRKFPNASCVPEAVPFNRFVGQGYGVNLLKRAGGLVFVLIFSLFTWTSLFADGLVWDENEFGPVNGKTMVWNFKESLPAGGTLRKGAELKNGLVPQSFSMSSPAGFVLETSKKVLLPDAFEFEAQFIPGYLPPGVEKKDVPTSSILWDSMFITYFTKPNDERCNKGFQVALQQTREGIWHPILYLGFGTMTDQVVGPKVDVKPGQAVKLSFFFTANGEVLWDFEGTRMRSVVSATGPVAPARFAAVIGDRFGSNYHPFNGVVQQITITPHARSPFSVRSEGRSSFLRGEQNAKVRIVLQNGSGGTLGNLKIGVAQKSATGTAPAYKTFETTKKELAADATVSFDCPIETRLVPGRYSLEISIAGQTADGKSIEAKRNLEVGVGPIYADRLPTVMWMYNNHPCKEVMDFGFTHGLTSFGLASPEATPAKVQAGFAVLDDALLEGFRVVKTVSVSTPPGKPQDTYARINRDGSVFKTSKGETLLEVSHPELQKYNGEIAKANREAFGGHPGWGGILPNSERRDGVRPSFRSEPSQYKAASGMDIPAEVVDGTAPVAYASKLYPEGRVRNDDPLLKYYTWFWNGGDGWPTLNSVIADEYRQGADPSFFSYFDPAVRVPPKWGSGGKVDVLSQWVYATPEPLCVGGPVEELFAMAAGRGQEVMIMTQIICYRARLAPKTVKVNPTPQWVVEKPDADFPTIPPDSIQEATWTMIAKPVKGIMYHGYACIVETGAKTGYTYTNPETAKRLKYMLNDVVAPLGPMLKHLGRVDSPVAVFESFTNAVMGGGCTMGWNSSDLLFLQRCRLDPRVIYEETIERDGFGNAKVLFMPKCSYLTESMIARILDFQKKGGIIIGDEKLISAIKADIVVPLTVMPVKDVDTAKEKMLADVEQLRKELASRYTPEADSSSPELITFRRQCGTTNYLFVINDKRTFGSYVGQWKLTMEKGLPYEGFATLADPNRKINAVYELSRGGKVPFVRTESGCVKVDLKYTTNDGRLLLFLEKPIASVDLHAAKEVRRGEKLDVQFRVAFKNGRPVKALLPGEIRLFDPQGNEIDGGGYVCVENGRCDLVFQTNLNSPAGIYKLTAKDRASGLTTETSVIIK